MALKTISEEWDGFAEMVLPANASPVQRAEMRKAFFAGAWSLLTQLKFIGTDAVTEEQGIAHMETLETECKLFKSILMREYERRN